MLSGLNPHEHEVNSSTQANQEKRNRTNKNYNNSNNNNKLQQQHNQEEASRRGVISAWPQLCQFLHELISYVSFRIQSCRTNWITFGEFSKHMELLYGYEMLLGSFAVM